MKTNRLQHLFGRKNSELLSVYFTAGFPCPESTPDIILALQQGGIDMVEVGMPFSDPMADGPTIQSSSTQALRGGMTLARLLQGVAEARRRGADTIPVVLMSYLNPLMQYGPERLMADALAAGVDSLIIPDLPFASAGARGGELHDAACRAGMPVIHLITPETSPERLRLIDEATAATPGAFIYMVSDAATTGTRDGFGPRQHAYFGRIAAAGLRSPRLIGFGISNPSTLADAFRYSSGAIIGSLFVKALAQAAEAHSTDPAAIPRAAIGSLLGTLGLKTNS